MYAKTLSEVKEKVSEIYSIKQNHNISATKLTVKEVAEQWISSARFRVKESSYANYESTVNQK